jgi:DNA-binding LacI/PurR family transcriptional regulator
MGIEAVQTLLSLIINKENKPVHKKLDFELIIRESTKIKNTIL